MRKVLIMTMLCIVWPSADVSGQHQSLLNWHDTIKNISFQIQNNENVYVKKEILYNGSVIPIAYGGFSYLKSDSINVTMPFLYNYGRIIVAKDAFDNMMESLVDSSKVSVYVAFQPIRISELQKTIDGYTSLSFVVRKKNLFDLYLNQGSLSLCSYWAITTLKDCYKVVYKDYNYGGYYYYAPYDNSKRKRLVEKLDRLYSKQYQEGYNILNYF